MNKLETPWLVEIGPAVFKRMSKMLKKKFMDDMNFWLSSRHDQLWVTDDVTYKPERFG